MADAVDTASALVASAAALLRERTLDDISYRALGESVGVSERTVYRHFPTRSHLLAELARWVEENHLPAAGFSTLPDFRLALRRRFADFDAAPAYAFVLARAASISPAGRPPEAAFTASVLSMIKEASPGLDERDVRRVTVTLCYFASAQFWARMRTAFGMDAEEIAEVGIQTVDRALEALPAAGWAVA